MSKQDYLVDNFKTIYTSLFLIGLFFSFWYASHQILTGDQTQMLYKGYTGFLQNSWISYGNAASAVGNVPGSLSSLVVGLPLFVYNSPWAPMSFLIALHVVSFLLLDSIVKDVFSTKVRLVFVVLYWINPWFLFENILYNPSYLFFFSALHLWSAYKLKNESSFIYSFLHVLSIGMAMQLHYSWIILGFISTFLLYKNIVKVNWFGVIFAFIVIALSLIPYLQELLHNEEIRQNAGNKDGHRYIGWGGVHVYPVLKAFIYWLRYASFIFPNKLAMSSSFEWISSYHVVQMTFKYLFQLIFIAVGALSVWIAFKANKLFYNDVKQGAFKRVASGISKEEWLKLYVVGALVGVFISAVLSPIIFSYWHLIIVFISALIPLLFFAQTKEDKINRYFFIIVVYLLFVNTIASIDSRKFSYKNDYVQDTNTYISSTIQKKIVREFSPKNIQEKNKLIIV